MNRPDISRLNKNRGIFFKIGLMTALCLVIFAFNITVYVVENKNYETVSADEFDFEEIIRTPPETKPVLPPPDLKVTENILPDEPEFTDEPIPDAIPDEIIPDSQFVKPVSPAVISTPPKRPDIIPEIKPASDEPEIFDRVEEMPRFPGCEDPGMTKQEKVTCAEDALLKYLYSNVRYPEIAVKLGIEGTVVVEFVVEKTGAISNIVILNEIGGGCGMEVVRLVKAMPNWIPGKQRDKAVNVRYRLPVRFDLL